MIHFICLLLPLRFASCFFLFLPPSCLLYFGFSARRHRYYELPHWSGGYYKGWACNGLPHGPGDLLMLMPSGSLLARAEWSFGDLQGLCTIDCRDTQQNLVTRFQGEYRKNVRLYGEQEWFDASGAVVKKFSGSWNGDQPGNGVWTYSSTSAYADP